MRETASLMPRWMQETLTQSQRQAETLHNDMMLRSMDLKGKATKRWIWSPLEVSNPMQDVTF